MWVFWPSREPFGGGSAERHWLLTGVRTPPGVNRIFCLMSQESLLQQVQQAIQQFEEVPLAESARRAYRVALRLGDTDAAYRLALNLWDNKSARDHQKFKTRLYGKHRSESAEQRMQRCAREHIIERTPSRLRGTGPEVPVVFSGSIAALQSMLDTSQQIHDDARSVGSWEAAAAQLPDIHDRTEIIDRIRQWVFDYLVRTEQHLMSSDAGRAKWREQAGLGVADLHPWVAGPAGPLFEDGHWLMAVTAAADNVRAQWKKKLGSETDDLPSAFSPNDPKVGHPRLRFPSYDRTTTSRIGTTSMKERCISGEDARCEYATSTNTSLRTGRSRLVWHWRPCPHLACWPAGLPTQKWNGHKPGGLPKANGRTRNCPLGEEPSPPPACRSSDRFD